MNWLNVQHLIEFLQHLGGILRMVLNGFVYGLYMLLIISSKPGLSPLASPAD
jgi:hypothetical protein